jgi:hypothetical protein
MTEKLTTPFSGTPSETYKAGYCPGCGGTGVVNRCVPVDGTYPCGTCGGGGTREAMDAYIERMAEEVG